MALQSFPAHVLTGDHASLPLATDVAPGTLYSCTDHGIIYQSDGAVWADWATITGAAPGAHAASHQNGGADEISVAGLSGLLADGQTPIAHKTTHENGGADEISVAGLSGLLADDQNPTAHAADHQNGGGDEISVTGLSGELADAQKVAVHLNGTLVGTRKNINFIEATGIQIGITDDAGDDEVDVEIEATGGGGAVVQVVNTQSGAVATGTTLIPLDDTIPQITEGNEYLTCAITPTDAANLLRIDIVMFLSCSNANWLSIALFQDSTANALAANSAHQPTATGMLVVTLTHFMTAGTIIATTFRVRGGLNSAGTMGFNGSGGRKFGGVASSSITITEIIP